MRHELPQVDFRVLIIGTANAGKTSILQRVCETTDSPQVFRIDKFGERERIQLDPQTERGQHAITDELVFENHPGYIFHDSCGLECENDDELNAIKNFIQFKSKKKGLQNRLHAIWYCIPMDCQRPSLEFQYWKEIRQVVKVPVVAVFTKFDQFKTDILLKIENDGHPRPVPIDIVNGEIEKTWKEHYLKNIPKHAAYVRLEKMDQPGERCEDLIRETANALTDDDAVLLMLLALKRQNYELNIKVAMDRYLTDSERSPRSLMVAVVGCFPMLFLALINLPLLPDPYLQSSIEDEDFFPPDLDLIPTPPESLFDDSDDVDSLFKDALFDLLFEREDSPPFERELYTDKLYPDNELTHQKLQRRLFSLWNLLEQTCGNSGDSVSRCLIVIGTIFFADYASQLLVHADHTEETAVQGAIRTMQTMNVLESAKRVVEETNGMDVKRVAIDHIIAHLVDLSDSVFVRAEESFDQDLSDLSD